MNEIKKINVGKVYSIEEEFFPRPLWGRYISAALAKSGPLDITSEKSFLLFFTHENGLGHMFQKQFSCSPILLFCVAISRK